MPPKKLAAGVLDENIYMGGTRASKVLGVHYRTLYNWDKEGKIEVIRSDGGKRFYNVKKYIDEKVNIHTEEKKNNKISVCYCRVSSEHQKEDLERQVNYMKEKYPDYTIIKDIGSGINFNRRGLNRLIDLGIENRLNSVVIAYRDRLTRFGYEMIERILKVYSDCDIIVENKMTQKNKPEEEIVQDVMQILQVFNSRINGMRKYKKKEKD
jgi:predicted site-specific integrase-resolvase